MILTFIPPGCAIGRFIRNHDYLVVVIRARRLHDLCPTGNTASPAVHSRYDRRPADLPSFDQPVTLRLRMRRFYCHHPAGRTFAEPPRG